MWTIILSFSLFNKCWWNYYCSSWGGCRIHSCGLGSVFSLCVCPFRIFNLWLEFGLAQNVFLLEILPSCFAGIPAMYHWLFQRSIPKFSRITWLSLKKKNVIALFCQHSQTEVMWKHGHCCNTKHSYTSWVWWSPACLWGN